MTLSALWRSFQETVSLSIAKVQSMYCTKSVGYNTPTSHVSNYFYYQIQSEGLLYDAESNLLQGMVYTLYMWHVVLKLCNHLAFLSDCIIIL